MAVDVLTVARARHLNGIARPALPGSGATLPNLRTESDKLNATTGLPRRDPRNLPRHRRFLGSSACLGLEPLAKYEHVPGWRIVAQGDTTMTEHTERWTWASGETVDLPFVSILVWNADGKITRWWDYWDLGTVMNAAPGAWVEHIMVGYK